MSRAFEICVDSPEGVIAARDGHADRVELCDNLFEGGTTPSIGAIKMARRVGGIKLHVIIRPRGGDFLYSDVEFETMRIDVEAARTARADGIVVGLLTSDRNIDKERTSELATLARPMSVTFHRAFDVCRDPFAALEDLIEIGVDRVLTSGQQVDALNGVETIKKLVEAAGDRIAVMVCGGVDESNAAEVVASDFEEAGDEDVFRKVSADIKAKGASVSDDMIRKKMAELTILAREQILAEG